MISKLVLISGLIFTSQVLPETKLLTFTNPTIHLLDGIPYMMDGVAIHNTLSMIKKAIVIHMGRNDGKKISGNYQYQGQSYSVHQLAKFEQENPNDPALKDLLVKAKHDFIMLTRPFIKDISTAKQLIMNLIEEFCDRRNRKDSIILSWSNTKPGGEEDAFANSVKSFRDLDLFFTDLILFLKDLVHSCPKACEQYKEWYKQKMSRE